MADDSRNPQRREDTQDNQPDPILTTTAASTQPKQQEEQQQQREKQKKKKSRGNRKLQRFRAKLKKQGLNTETITTLINQYNNPSRLVDEREEVLVLDVNMEEFVELHDPSEVQEKHETAQTKTSKRKRETRPTGVTTSLSQMSIAQPATKRQRSTTADYVIQPKDTGKSKSNDKPDYLKLPDHVFKKMLSTSMEGMENIAHLLDTPEKLQYARDYAQLVNDLFYLRLKLDFWINYYKIAIDTGVWSLTISKQIIKENNLYPIQFLTQKNVEKRRQTVIAELKQAEDELNKHKQLAIDQSININRLLTAIPAFVRKGQHKLSADFERRKLLLQLDANNHRQVQAFYNLQPTDNQIISAKIIWQATADQQQSKEHVAILKQRIYTKRLPASFNLLDHSIDNMEKMFEQPVLHEDKRATLSSQRRKTIDQFKYNMMVLEITTAEEIVRSHTNIILNEKKKLIDTANGQVPLPQSLVTILYAIKARQSNITQRAQMITKQKISFFDHAPTVMEEAGTVGAML